MLRVCGRFCVLTIILSLAASAASADNVKTPSGLAFVIGQAEHLTYPSPQADQDAGLIAATLAKKDFAVMAARNLDSTLIKSAIADFKSAAKAAPTLPVVIYLGGQFVQAMNENHLATTDLKTIKASDMNAAAVSLSALVNEIAQLTSGPKLVIIDGARLPMNGNIVTGLSAGLAIPKASGNVSIILNQSPGMFAKDTDAPYQAFALAVADGIQRSTTPRDFADFVILRTFELSKGQQIPWAVTQDDKSGNLFTSSVPSKSLFNDLHTKPKSALDATQAFAAAMLKGSIISYEEYNLIHIQNPMTKISHAVLAALRDSQIWQETNTKPSASGYWGYLNLYPNGLHANEARQALTALGQPTSPLQGEPFQIFATSPPSHDELAILSTIVPYRLDETSANLAAVSGMIKTLLPAMADSDRSPAKPIPAPTRHGLPLPPLDNTTAEQIKLPPSVPNSPIDLPAEDPAEIKKPQKQATPLPPNRQTSTENAQATEEPALITITIPLLAPTPSPASAPTPQATTTKPKQAKPATDVFEQSFGSETGDQNLPY